jgi:hypothetical protein
MIEQRGKGGRMVGLWVAVGLAIVAFVIGRAVGKRNGLIKNWLENIRGDMQDIEMIIKYHCESLPLVAKDLMDDYGENRKFHEEDGVDMMRAVAYHYSRITDNLVPLALKSSSKAKEVEKAMSSWLPPLVAKAENAEAAFVQQIRMAVDPKFREHFFEMNQQSFDHFVKTYGYLESYWEHSPLYQKENPNAP